MKNSSKSKIKYRSRIIDGEINRCISEYDAVCIIGPAQCGKTSTASRHAKSKIPTNTPASEYPVEPEERLSPILIDEITGDQETMGAFMHTLDCGLRKGRFILTSSYDWPFSIPKTKKLKVLRMGTMSLYETGDSSGAVSLKELCGEKEITPYITGTVTRDKIAHYIVRGGWPEPSNNDAKATSCKTTTSDWHAILKNKAAEKGIYNYDNKLMDSVMHCLAMREGCTTNIGKIYEDVSNEQYSDKTNLNPDIVKKYIRLLEGLYLTDGIYPFANTMVGQIEWHFCDTSIICSLNHMNENDVLNNAGAYAVLFDSLCKHELKIYAESLGANVSFHKTVYKKNKSDIVLELPDEKWCIFKTVPWTDPSLLDLECKRLCKKCDRIQEEQRKRPPAAMCVMCDTYDMAYRREDGVTVVPITALGP